MSSGAGLPDLDTLNQDALKALILAQPEEILLPGEQLQTQDEQRAWRQAEIERLQLLIAKLRRMPFGRRSEKLDRQMEQLELRLDELQTAQAETRADSPSPEATERAADSAKPVRRPLPSHLPRQGRTILPKETACPDCGGELKALGEDVSEMLEYVPAHFQVIRQVRPQLACSRCDKIVQAEAPSRPIARGLAGPGLLAHVVVSKYCDHLPLYRQEEIYAREGVELERATLADWVGGTSQLRAPLVEALRRHGMRPGKLHADDTPVPVLAPGLGRTKTGRLWTSVRDDRPAGDATPPAVWFAYSPDRKGEHPQAHLSHFSGTLQADAYAGFDHLYESGRIREAACWAHGRRKFCTRPVDPGDILRWRR
jgi:transposase